MRFFLKKSYKNGCSAPRPPHYNSPAYCCNTILSSSFLALNAFYYCRKKNKIVCFSRNFQPVFSLQTLEFFLAEAQKNFLTPGARKLIYVSACGIRNFVMNSQKSIKKYTKVAAWLEDRKRSLLSSGRGTLTNKWILKPKKLIFLCRPKRRFVQWFLSNQKAD